MSTSHPRVFISYSHDDEAHKQRVYDLSEELIDGGIESYMDEYVLDPPEGWPRWMSSQIEAADFVLVVATPTYLLRFDGKEERGSGLGIKWEGAIIRNELYQEEGVDAKFLPVIFEPEHKASIPVPLRGRSYYLVSSDDGFEMLYRRITGQTGVQRGVLGEIRVLPPRRIRSQIDPVLSAGTVGRLTPEPARSESSPKAPRARRSARSAAGEAPTRNSGEPATDRPPLRRPAMKTFLPEILDRTVISTPLQEEMAQERLQKRRSGSETTRVSLYDVIIELDRFFPGDLDGAQERVRQLIARAIGDSQSSGAIGQAVDEQKTRMSNHYVFARLEGSSLRELARLDRSEPGGEAVYRIWPDFAINALSAASLRTIRADVSQEAYGSLGRGITWAVIDSGIQGDHPHFSLHGNLELPPPLKHLDLTAPDQKNGAPLTDRPGHGTHVAGIIAGERNSGPRSPDGDIVEARRWRDELGEISYQRSSLRSVSGVAPRCRLMSIKVLDDSGFGLCSSIIVALEHINRLNDHGRRIIIHGVNISVGYDFEPGWFASGVSPLCDEINQLVKSGVAVVVPAGNSGHIRLPGLPQSVYGLGIPDPGNAELALTVGSTHAVLPEVYGVSFFSSKGPTADGRRKPDLVAPGEKIRSCAAGRLKEELTFAGVDAEYVENTGTSLAAAHVSGALAAFLSVRRGYIGRPLDVKRIFQESAKDLGREPSHQGHGLIDLQRAIEVA